MSKFIRIGIADKNDNPPYFDKSLYEAEVDENEDIQHTVLTVTASDKDECEYCHNIYQYWGRSFSSLSLSLTILCGELSKYRNWIS